MHRDTGSDRLQTIERGQVDLRHVRNGPAQVRDGRHGVHFFERAGGELIFVERERVLLKRPTVLGHQLQRRLIVRGRRASLETPCGREFADAREPEHVIAKSGERVVHALFQDRDIRGRVLRKKVDAQAAGHLVFAMQRQESVIHGPGI